MKFTATREQILQPLQSIIGVVERRQTMPILSNVLLAARNNRLTFTGTDLEVELAASGEAQVQQAGDVTIPGRKLLDIVRSLADGVQVTVTRDAEKISVRAGRSRFSLGSMPATEFPVIEDVNAQVVLAVPQAELRRLIDKTAFAMAQQDVRYYLNGLLFEADGQQLRGVATDGHRLALCDVELSSRTKAKHQVIVPRKGVLELQRILGAEGVVELAIGTNHVRAQIGDIRFTSKLIDGRFPEYGRVIPNNPPRAINAERESLRQALQRTAILANEKFRGVRLSAKSQLLTLQAHNPEQEEAEDQLEVEYDSEEMEIGFNVNYLLEALAALDSDRVSIGLTDANSSCLITAPGVSAVRYVVMPMRL